MKNVAYLYAKIYIVIIQRASFCAMRKERETATFKTYDTRLHIQTIYCRLSGRCPSCPVAQQSVRLSDRRPVATELNYQQYHIKG